MSLNFILVYILVTSLANAYQRCSVGDGVKKGTINDRYINEASGLVYSRKSSKVLWVHNDSGGTNWIYAISEQGKQNMFINKRAVWLGYLPWPTLFL